MAQSTTAGRTRPDLTAGGGLTRRLDALIGRIERAEALDTVAGPVAALEKKLGEKLPWWRNLASGTFLGHPLHPLLVAVPIGSWSASLLFDLAGDRRGARRLVGVGLLAALPTMASGGSDWAYTNGAEQRVGLVHAGANGLSLLAFGLSWQARRRGHHGQGVLWSLVGATAVSVGGWLGGHLSYALGVGVDTTAFQHSTAEWTEVARSEDVTEGALRAADVGGVPLVLTRLPGGTVIALADRCSHRGAPLHEGELDDGCLVCPWHRSVFATDGAVVRGPATRPQQSYAVLERDGAVSVRIADEPRSLRTNPVGP